MPLFSALSSEVVAAYRAGAPDAHGHPPERTVSKGGGNPCRHCLRNIPEGTPMLVLAHRPFAGTHPYAEVGPIFLCAEPCARGGGCEVPEILRTSPDYLLKGYSADERIVYGTGGVVAAGDIPSRLQALLDDRRIAWVDVRSARNNCFLARVVQS